jgi:hypothetical protein
MINKDFFNFIKNIKVSMASISILQIRKRKIIWTYKHIIKVKP